MSGERITFRWGNLWRIFWASLEELSFGEMFCRMSFVLGLAHASCYGIVHNSPVEPYAPMARSFYVGSWVFFVFFRYYFLPSFWKLSVQITASLFYGVILGSLITFYYSVSTDQVIIVIISAAVSVMTLMGRRE